LLYLVLGHVVRLVLLLVRGDRSKELEILAFRHQVAVLRGQVHRLDLIDADRPAGGTVAAVASPFVGDVLRDAVDAPALAP
jgi:hypothetical protein